MLAESRGVNQVKPNWHLCQNILPTIILVCVVGLIGCDWLGQEDILLEARFVPKAFDACQGKTRLEYTLLEASYVSIAIYDSAGRQVVQLVDNHQELEGMHSYDWHGRDAKGNCVPAGLYIASVKAGDEKIEVIVRIF